MRDRVDYIYKILAEKYGVSEKAIRTIEVDFWRAVKSELGKHRGKDIIIPNWGTLYLVPHKLRRMIKLYKSYQTKNAEDLEKGKDWMRYLRQYVRDARRIAPYLKVEEAIEKRKNRKKGERGL